MKNRLNEAQATYAAAPPQPTVESSVRRLLRGHMRELYEGLWAIIVSEAESSGLKIKEARLRRFDDPEEVTTTVVLEVTVVTDAARAMACWDSIGSSVDSWAKTLPAYLRDLFFGKWSFQVNWTENGSR